MPSTDKLPAPYPISANRGFLPFARRCGEIDEAALLIRDPAAFADMAKGDRILDSADPYVFLEKPDGPFLRRFTDEGGCPAFRGILNAGSTANVLCDLTSVQLHSYCEVKFCVKERKVYCPIWRARGG